MFLARSPSRDLATTMCATAAVVYGLTSSDDPSPNSLVGCGKLQLVPHHTGLSRSQQASKREESDITLPVRTSLSFTHPHVIPLLITCHVVLPARSKQGGDYTRCEHQEADHMAVLEAGRPF